MTVQHMEFKAEVKQLLELMIHSLYSHKEIFLRELISNASDAIDKARYEALTRKEIGEAAGEWQIRLTADKDAGTLTISDNGIGMTKDELVLALGTIAHSGTKEFLRAVQERNREANPELIGQFGVGFYSAFMVADRVTVLTRKAGKDAGPGVKWESTADGTYAVEETNKTGQGTDVVLHLKDEEKKYLDEWELRTIVTKYSDYIDHPIVMEVERKKPDAFDKDKTVSVREDEVLNSRKAIWLRDKTEISDGDYSEFYKHISHDFNAPSKVIHYRAEGTSEFTALLFIPEKVPYGIFFKEFKVGPTLYVRRVQIMEHCEELIPPYLRFIKGVVDSSDLPLNVSREILQSNRQIETIRKSLTKKVLDTLAEMKKDEPEKYHAFFSEFGRILKEGIHYDFAKKEQVADLLLFPSTKTGEGKATTFGEYVDAMKPDQEEIYYATGTSLDEVRKSPYLEAFREKDLEVLIMLDEVDDIIMGSLREYRGKKLKSITRGDIKLDKEEPAPGAKEGKKALERLLAEMKEILKDEVKDVRLSGRLRDSACCLVTDEGGIDPNMEKLLKAMGQDVPANLRIFEINADHPVVGAMNAIVGDETKRDLLRQYTEMLYSQALILEGSKPRDPAAFAKNLSRLMTESLSKG